MSAEFHEQTIDFATKLEAIHQRLHWLCEQPDGILFYEPSGVHFVRVEKKQSLIRLALVEQVSLTSDLVQSELDLDNPLNLVSRASQAMMMGLLWKSEPKRIYIAGLGGGIIPLFLHHYFPQATIECTDIDPTLIEVATKFFGLQLDEQLRVIIQDGREYLAQRNQEIEYDLIFIDTILGSGYAPYRLATKEFYELCKSHLSKEGAIVVNLLQSDNFYTEKVKTIQSAFEQVYLCPVKGGNRIIIANNGSPKGKPEIIYIAKFLQESYQFSFSLVPKAIEIKIGEKLQEYVPNLDQVQILRDASPPTDYFDKLPSFNPVFAKVDKNHPCPCGSGQLFKDCHGQSLTEVSTIPPDERERGTSLL